MADDHGTPAGGPDAAIPGEGTPFHGAEAGPAEPAAGEPAEAAAGGPAAGDEGAPLHPDLAPLAFLLGRWEGAGVGGYPTIESFQFGQEMVFSHNGKPFLSYTSRTWLLDAEGHLGRPLATESGFWRPQPDGKVELLLAHPTGITEIYLGEINGTRVDLITDVVARTETAKEYSAGRRLYGLIGEDLGWAYDMAAVGQPLQSHISAQLKRVG
jgi:THAP4-like, heme-binding beta-barrel domain